MLLYVILTLIKAGIYVQIKIAGSLLQIDLILINKSCPCDIRLLYQAI